MSRAASGKCARLSLSSHKRETRTSTWWMWVMSTPALAPEAKTTSPRGPVGRTETHCARIAKREG